MATLDSARMKLSSGDAAAKAEVEAELAELARTRPWTTWNYEPIRQLYMRLGEIQGQVDVGQLMIDVSGEAWKIANVASPHYNHPDSVRRRQPA